MAQKTMTIETLAEMINEGFKTTASKRDVAALRSETQAEFNRREPLAPGRTTAGN
jgi:hypothetical protein